MGYYSKFEVEVVGTKNLRESVELCQEFLDIILYNVYDKVIDDYLFTFTLDDAKWYDNEDQCGAFAEKYPHLTITVYGTGEESGDIWKARYRGDQMERIELPTALPPFQKLTF